MEEILIKNKEELENLKIDNKQKVCYFCQNCKKLRKQYLYSLKEKPENLLFCPHCKTSKGTKQTCLRKYGVTNPAQSQQSKEKHKQTCLEKYGVDSYTKTKEYKEKYKQTSLRRYQTEHPFQNKNIQNKRKQTFERNYKEG